MLALQSGISMNDRAAATYRSPKTSSQLGQMRRLIDTVCANRNSCGRSKCHGKSGIGACAGKPVGVKSLVPGFSLVGPLHPLYRLANSTEPAGNYTRAFGSGKAGSALSCANPKRWGKAMQIKSFVTTMREGPNNRFNRRAL